MTPPVQCFSPPSCTRAADLTFSSDNITAVLALTTDAFTLACTMSLSILLLRPVYFLAAAFVDYLDALDSALGIILVVIGGKLLLSQAGIEVPLGAVVGLLTAWRVAVAAYIAHKAMSDKGSGGASSGGRS